MKVLHTSLTASEIAAHIVSPLRKNTRAYEQSQFHVWECWCEYLRTQGIEEITYAEIEAACAQVGCADCVTLCCAVLCLHGLGCVCPACGPICAVRR